MKKVVALVAAAGVGRRMKSSRPKTLLEIEGRPVLSWTLEAFQRHPLIDEIVLVFQPGLLKEGRALVRRHRFTKVKSIVAGGATRQVSVKNGLAAVDPRASLVAIHDGARPCVDPDSINRVLAAAERCGAAILGVPAKSTIKSVDLRGRVTKTLRRDGLWEIQTPQVFSRSLIDQAYRQKGSSPVSDDAALVERLGCAVRVVEGSYFNIKVTTPEDMVLAAAILGARRPKGR